MESVLARLQPNARVAVIRLRSLGDCVLTTPALKLLRQARPDLRIGVVAETAFRDVFAHNAVVDQVLPPDLLAVRRFASDLVINLHGGTRSMWMTALSGARLRAGFAHHRYAARAYNVAIPRAQEILGEDRPVHTAEHLASAMFYLGVPHQVIPQAVLPPVGQSRRDAYAVIHAVAATPEKTWSADNFITLAKSLQTQGLTPVFIGAATDNLAPFKNFEVQQGLAMADVRALIAGATLFIGNDSGPAHIAAAYSVPVVVLFGPSNAVTWAPWRTESKVLTSPEGIERITVDEVLQACDRLKVHR